MPRFACGVVAALFASTLPIRLEAQVLEAGPVRLALTGRAQIQFNTTSVDEEDVGLRVGDVPSSTFEPRRIRFGWQLEVDDWITAQVQPEFALGQLRLTNAYLNLAFGTRAELRLGQFKRPFSRIFLTSSSTIPPIERGARIRGIEDAFEARVEPDEVPDFFLVFPRDLVVAEEQALLDALGYLGFDVGAALHGRLGTVGYELGIFNGTGADARDDNDGKSLAGRLEYRPWKDRPLVLAASTSYRELLFDGLLGGVEVNAARLAGTAFSVDAEWGGFRRAGLHLIAEAAAGENLAIDEPLLAAQAILAYFRPLQGRRFEGLEPVFRASFGDPNTERGGDHGWLLTPGVNLYAYGRNRLMLDWDAFFPGSERFDTEHSLRMQAQVYF